MKNELSLSKCICKNSKISILPENVAEVGDDVLCLPLHESGIRRSKGDLGTGSVHSSSVTGWKLDFDAVFLNFPLFPKDIRVSLSMIEPLVSVRCSGASSSKLALPPKKPDLLLDLRLSVFFGR